MSRKVHNNWLCRYFTMTRIQQKSCSPTNHFQVMVATLWKTRHVATVPLEKYKPINCVWYRTTCLPVVFQEIKKTIHRRHITLHRNHCIVLTGHRVANFYWRAEKKNWVVNVFQHLSIWLMPFRTLVLDQNGKNASTIGSNACNSV